MLANIPLGWGSFARDKIWVFFSWGSGPASLGNRLRLVRFDWWICMLAREPVVGQLPFLVRTGKHVLPGVCFVFNGVMPAAPIKPNDWSEFRSFVFVCSHMLTEDVCFEVKLVNYCVHFQFKLCNASQFLWKRKIWSWEWSSNSAISINVSMR